MYALISLVQPVEQPEGRAEENRFGAGRRHGGAPGEEWLRWGGVPADGRLGVEEVRPEAHQGISLPEVEAMNSRTKFTIKL